MSEEGREEELGQVYRDFFGSFGFFECFLDFFVVFVDEFSFALCYLCFFFEVLNGFLLHLYLFLHLVESGLLLLHDDFLTPIVIDCFGECVVWFAFALDELYGCDLAVIVNGGCWWFADEFLVCCMEAVRCRVCGDCSEFSCVELAESEYCEVFFVVVADEVFSS